VLAEWIQTPKFSTTRLRPGYDIDQVDAFIDDIRDSFLGERITSLTPDEIRKKQFSTTRLRPGYDEEEVDAFLNEAESRLAAQVSARRACPAAEPGSRAAEPRDRGSAFAAYDGDGVEIQDSILMTISYVPPGGDDWAAGDRRLVCIAFWPNDQGPALVPMVGSFKGTGQ
jgi:DivIVA domain-containing protein